MSVLDCHKTRDGPTRAGNDDILSEDHLPQQPGEVGLRFVNADLPHDDPILDQGHDQGQLSLGTDTATDTVTITVTPANRAPTANAGTDQTVSSGASVTLDGSGSSDPDTGDTLTYSWSQTSGTTVSLTGTTTASPTFTAPTVTASTSLVFTLTVSDGTASATDTVTITVNPASTGTCSRTDPNAGSYTAWDSTRNNYVGGDQVSHKGLVWEAEYWTQEEPVITATDWPGTWKLLSTTELKWHPERVYVKDDEARHAADRARARDAGSTPARGPHHGGEDR